MSEKRVITEFKDREEFKKLINEHKGVVILKFGATWCAP